jgi:hypothetical protein
MNALVAGFLLGVGGAAGIGAYGCWSLAKACGRLPEHPIRKPPYGSIG